MDPDLVGAPRGDRHFEERRILIGKPADDADVAYRRTAVGAVGVDGSRQRVRDRPDGRVDGEGVRHPGPRRQGQIDLEDAPLEHGLGQRASGRGVAGEEDGPGRAAAEAVERRARVAVTLADQMEQGIFQEEAAGEDRQPGGFREDQDVVVLEQGREIRGSIGLLPGQAMVEEGVAAGQQVVRRGRKPVEQDLAGLDPPPPFGLRGVGIAAACRRTRS